MPCTTFLHDGECNIPTSNAELNELLAEVRLATGKNWQITERSFTEKKFLRKQKTFYSYQLYVYVGGCGPWQVINFYRDETDTTLNYGVTAELIIAYFYGILSGVNCQKRLHAKQD